MQQRLALLDSSSRLVPAQLPDVAATDLEVAAAVAAGRRTQMTSVQASRPLQAADESTLLWDDVAAGATITIPTDATLALPVGYWVDVQRPNTAGKTGPTNVVAANSVTLVSEAGMTAIVLGGRGRLHKVAPNTWVLTGDLQADTGWINLPLTSPWTAVAEGARYRLKQGQVFFQIGAARNGAASGSAVGVFPAGARPPYVHWWTGIFGGLVSEVRVETNGTVTYGQGSTGAAGGVVLSGSFLTN